MAITGIDSDWPWAGCYLQNMWILGNGLDSTRVVELVDGTGWLAGTNAPNVAPVVSARPGGSCSVGEHLVRYRYRRRSTGKYSDPSPSSSVTCTAANRTIRVSVVASTEPEIDQIVIEVTQVSGTEYYWLDAFAVDGGTTANNATANVDISISDATLDGSAIFDQDAHARAGDNVPPPVKPLWLASRGVVFAWGGVRYNVGSIAINGTALTGYGTKFKAVMAGSRMAPLQSPWLVREAAQQKLLRVSGVLSETSIVLEEAGVLTSNNVYEIYPPDASVLWISKPGLPEQFNPDWAMNVPAEDDGDWPTGMVELSTGVIGLVKESHIYILSYQSNPSGGVLDVLPGWGDTRGAVAQRAMAMANGWVYAIDGLGIHRFNAVGGQDIGEPIYPIIRDQIDFAYRHKFMAVHDPERNSVLFFLVKVGTTVPKYALIFNYRSGSWIERDFSVGITSCALGYTPHADRYRPTVFLGDENGGVYYYGRGRSDGVSPKQEILRLTVAFGGDATNVNVNEPLLTAADGLRLAPVYWVEGKQTRVISSNTDAQFTVTPAFSSVPAVGHTMLLGRILTEIESKDYDFGDPHARRKLTRFGIDFTGQTDDVDMKLEFYLDGKKTLANVGNEALDEDGVGINPSADYYTLSMRRQKDEAGGNTLVSCRHELGGPAEAFRTIRHKLIYDEPGKNFEILGWEYVVVEESLKDVDSG